MIKLWLSFCLLLCCRVVWAQFDQNYSPISSIGQLPAEFVTRSSEKFEMEKAKLASKKIDKDRKAKERFLLQSNFGVDEVLLSGKVLFNDTITLYLNQVLDKILINDPKLRNELKVYVVKSSSVNAFATNQGLIFVNLGLLAQVENESQLAFVLCHEVIHYREKHPVERYVKAEKIGNGDGAYRSMSLEDRVLSTNNFSKEQEAEADIKGFELFEHTAYSGKHLLGIFDVLKYAYLPYDEVAFKVQVFEHGHYIFPESYSLQNTSPINTTDAVDEEEEKKSTHPGIPARRDTIQAKLQKLNNNGKSEYLVSQTEFETCREMARFELSRMYALQNRPEAALYNSYLLLQAHPDNLYAKKNMAYALVSLSAYSGNGNSDDVIKDWEKMEGKQQSLYHFISSLDSAKEELNILAVSYTAGLVKAYPHDADIKYYLQMAMNAMQHNYHLGLDKFVDTFIASAAIDTNVLLKKNSNDREKVTKYEKIKNQSKEIASNSASLKYWNYAFLEYKNEAWFKAAYDSAVRTDVSSERTYYRFHEGMYSLGLDKVLVLDPFYMKLDSRKEIANNRYLESEDGQIRFVDQVDRNAKLAKVDAPILNLHDLKAEDIDRFNDINFTKEYILNKLGQSEGVVAPSLEKEKMMQLAERYGTNNFLITGAIADQKKIRHLGGLILVSVLFPPAWFTTIPVFANNGHYTYYYALLYNIKEDKVKLVHYREIRGAGRSTMMNSHLYDTFFQIHKQAKKHR